MANAKSLAITATQRIRDSQGYASLPEQERVALDQNLLRLEQTLHGGDATAYDPYAQVLATPADLQRDLTGADGGYRGVSGPQAGQATQPGNGAHGTTPAPTAPSSPADLVGGRTAGALEAVDFTGFVAGLVSGTFQAIVDSTARQVREYADLVASLSQSVDSFGRDNVTPAQVRDWLVERHHVDLYLSVPRPGQQGRPRLRPKSQSAGTSPQWLGRYGLEGASLDDDFVDGPLVDAAHTALAKDRLQTLATMVLMGINRVVVRDGRIRARLQFHASAREVTSAEMTTQSGAQQLGIAARGVGTKQATTTMVSTVQANAQASASVKADLLGEVELQFATETFPLERFADSAAISLINRHARVEQAATTAGAAQPGSAGGAPADGATP